MPWDYEVRVGKMIWNYRETSVPVFSQRFNILLLCFRKLFSSCRLVLHSDWFPFELPSRSMIQVTCGVAKFPKWSECSISLMEKRISRWSCYWTLFVLIQSREFRCCLCVINITTAAALAFSVKNAFKRRLCALVRVLLWPSDAGHWFSYSTLQPAICKL